MLRCCYNVYYVLILEMMEEISHFLNSVCVLLFNPIPLVDEATYALPTVNEKALRETQILHMRWL